MNKLHAAFSSLTVPIMLTIMQLSPPSFAQAQEMYHSKHASITIRGSSTLHDWDMQSSQGNVEASIVLTEGQLKSLNSLRMSVAAETLKSKRSGLDKNAYKSLQTDKFKNISYQLSKSSIHKSGNSYTIVSEGTLQLAGKNFPLKLTATGQLQSKQQLLIKGSTTFNMSSYGIKPPTVMMGTIKTGDQITIDYQVLLTK